MLKRIMKRIANNPLVLIGVLGAALDGYDGEPTWRGIGIAVLTALARFVVTGPLTTKG